jgi:hypothetical protein
MPASNAAFPRSEKQPSDIEVLIRACWPVHEWILQHLGIRWVVVCGSQAAKTIVECLGGTTEPPDKPVEAGWSTFRLVPYVAGEVTILSLPTFTQGWDPTREDVGRILDCFLQKRGPAQTGENGSSL